jgi:hypothetical protein
VILRCLIFSLYLISSSAFGKTLYIPTPSLPLSFNPLNIIDIFSINVVNQIHKTLFTVNENQDAVPEIVKTFNVSRDGRVYHFELKKMFYHDGQSLEAKDVKDSLERSIKNKVVGSQKFDRIIGFDEFLSGKAKIIDGIKVKNKREFTINLNKAFPRMIKVLSDPRYSIFKNTKKSEVGLGEYKVASTTKDKVTLSSALPNLFFDQIVYLKRDKKEAKAMFNLRSYISLMMYSISQKDAEDLKARTKARVLEVPSFRNYMLAVSGQRQKSLTQRNRILSVINREKIVNDCYKSEKISNNFVPFGFPGYRQGGYKLNLSSKVTKNKSIKETPLKIVVLRGVGNEICVRDSLKNQLKRFSPSVIIVDSAKGSNMWLNNEVDVLFLYMEAELGVDMLDFYVANEGFHLGDLEVKESFSKELNRLNSLSTNKDYYSSTIHLAQKIMARNTILPLFSPKLFILNSNKVPDFRRGYFTPTFSKFSKFENIK